tara:strand:- start:316 stop:474 length:159 start_codon:yes stop_codon:yes gene_type:complete
LLGRGILGGPGETFLIGDADAAAARAALSTKVFRTGDDFVFVAVVVAIFVVI